MSPRRTRRQVSRSVRAPEQQPLQDADFTRHLAEVAADTQSSNAIDATKSGIRRLVPAAVVALVLIAGSVGVAYGTGFVTPPWRQQPAAPKTPSPPSPSPTKSASDQPTRAPSSSAGTGSPSPSGSASPSSTSSASIGTASPSPSASGTPRPSGSSTPTPTSPPTPTTSPSKPGSSPSSPAPGQQP